MKKLLFAFTIITILVAMTGTAFAGGWWVEYGTPGDPFEPNLRQEAASDFPQQAASPWGNPNTPLGAPGPETPSPHGGFTDSTNQCKECHAIHNADATSYRLLHDTERMTECDWCHEAQTGRSSHRPYGELFIVGETVRGEHTMGTDPLATDQGLCIPNSTKNQALWGGPTPACPDDAANGDRNGRLPDRGVGDRATAGNGLYCFDCHSVHGGSSIGIVDDTVAGGWDDMILRVDPAGDGGNVETDGVDPINAGNNSFTDDAIRTAFCQDCHDLTMGWDEDPADDLVAGGPAARPNPTSHVQGPAANWFMEVYGADTQVAYFFADANAAQGCYGCHSSDSFEAWKGVDKSDPADDPAGGLPGDFPHQGTGHKLLADDYQDAQPGAWGTGPYEATTFGEVVGDPRRPLDAMDRICQDCHTDTNDPATATAGVGITY